MSYMHDNTVPGSDPSYGSNVRAPGSTSYTDNTTAPGSTTQSTSGMRSGANAGATTGRKMEGIMSSLHGAGEQIRGQFNMAVDTVMHDREGQARNQGIVNRGREEVATGRIIENPEKRRYPHVNYPAGAGAGAGTMAGAGTTPGTTTGVEPASGVRRGSLTEDSYGAPGPTNAHRHPGPGNTGGGQAIGGGHYVADETRRGSMGY